MFLHITHCLSHTMSGYYLLVPTMSVSDRHMHSGQPRRHIFNQLSTAYREISQSVIVTHAYSTHATHVSMTRENISCNYVTHMYVHAYLIP